MCSPCTNHFSNPHHPSSPHSCPLPVVPAACPTSFVNLVSHPHAHKYKANATHKLLTISPSLHPRPSRNQRATAKVTGAFPFALPPARAVQTQTCTAGTSGIQSAESPKIRAAALGLPVLLMALDVLEHADTWIIDACPPESSSTHSVDEPNGTCPWLQTWVPKTHQGLAQAQKRQLSHHCSSRISCMETTSNSSSDLPCSVRNKPSPRRTVSPPV